MRRAAVLLAVVMLSPAGWAQEGRAASEGIFEIDPEAPLEITSESLEMQEDRGLAVFSGNVEAVQEGITIRSGMLEIRYRVDDGDSSGRRSIETIRATGSVVATSEFGILRGERAVYDLQARTLEASGGVVLERGDGSIKGEVFRVDLESGMTTMRSAGDGRVRAVFAPRSGGG